MEYFDEGQNNEQIRLILDLLAEKREVALGRSTELLTTTTRTSRCDNLEVEIRCCKGIIRA